MSEEKEKATYDDFAEFHERHPNMDNSEYYTEFPGVNKGTLRSWKAKAQKPIKDSQDKTEGKTWDREMVKLLSTQTNTPLSEFENVDTRSALIILKNRMTNQQKEKPKKKTSNGPILPHPAPIGQNKKQFPIDDYMVFDKVKNEIRMEIEMDTLMNPDTNAALRGKVYK